MVLGDGELNMNVGLIFEFYFVPRPIKWVYRSSYQRTLLCAQFRFPPDQRHWSTCGTAHRPDWPFQLADGQAANLTLEPNLGTLPNLET